MTWPVLAVVVANEGAQSRRASTDVPAALGCNAASNGRHGSIPADWKWVLKCARQSGPQAQGRKAHGERGHKHSSLQTSRRGHHHANAYNAKILAFFSRPCCWYAGSARKSSRGISNTRSKSAAVRCFCKSARCRPAKSPSAMRWRSSL